MEIVNGSPEAPVEEAVVCIIIPATWEALEESALKITTIPFGLRVDLARPFGLPSALPLPGRDGSKVPMDLWPEEEMPLMWEEEEQESISPPLRRCIIQVPPLYRHLEEMEAMEQLMGIKWLLRPWVCLTRLIA